MRLERTVKLPDDCVFVAAVPGVVASKTGAARAHYNRASLAAGRILEIWRSISGANDSTLAAVVTSSADSLDRLRAALRQTGGTESERLLNRFEQFKLESEIIIPQASGALAREDLSAFGKLVDESQAAAVKLRGNQVPATIWLARNARSLGGTRPRRLVRDSAEVYGPLYHEMKRRSSRIAGGWHTKAARTTPPATAISSFPQRDRVWFVCSSFRPPTCGRKNPSGQLVEELLKDDQRLV